MQDKIILQNRLPQACLHRGLHEVWLEPGGHADPGGPEVQPLHHPAPGSKTKAPSLSFWLNLFKSQQQFSPILPQDELQHAGVTFINNRKFPREATDMSQVSKKILG